MSSGHLSVPSPNQTPPMEPCTSKSARGCIRAKTHCCSLGINNRSRHGVQASRLPRSSPRNLMLLGNATPIAGGECLRPHPPTAQHAHPIRPDQLTAATSPRDSSGLPSLPAPQQGLVRRPSNPAPLQDKPSLDMLYSQPRPRSVFSRETGSVGEKHREATVTQILQPSVSSRSPRGALGITSEPLRQRDTHSPKGKEEVHPDSTEYRLAEVKRYHHVPQVRPDQHDVRCLHRNLGPVIAPAKAATHIVIIHISHTVTRSNGWIRCCSRHSHSITFLSTYNTRHHCDSKPITVFSTNHITGWRQVWIINSSGACMRCGAAPPNPCWSRELWRRGIVQLRRQAQPAIARGG